MPWMTRDGQNVYVPDDRVPALEKQGWTLGRSDKSSIQNEAYAESVATQLWTASTQRQIGSRELEEARTALVKEKERLHMEETALRTDLGEQKEEAAATVEEWPGLTDRYDEWRRSLWTMQEMFKRGKITGPGGALSIMNFMKDTVDFAKEFPGWRFPEEEQGIDLADALAQLAGALGGRGGGRVAPEYRPPDRRVVEDMVRDKMSLLIGQKNESTVQRLADVFMSDHRLNWEGKTDRDPTQSVTEEIRKLSEYKRIHALRPDTVDETEWFTAQLAGVRSLGVTPSKEAARAADQAATGTAAARAQEAASIFQQAGRASATPTFFRKISNAVTDMARMVQ